MKDLMLVAFFAAGLGAVAFVAKYGAAIAVAKLQFGLLH